MGGKALLDGFANLGGPVGVADGAFEVDHFAVLHIVDVGGDPTGCLRDDFLLDLSFAGVEHPATLPDIVGEFGEAELRCNCIWSKRHLHSFDRLRPHRVVGALKQL